MDRIYKLISQGLRAQAPGAHPEADLLSAFVENSLARGQRNQVIAHLADCTHCREVLYRSLPEIDQAQTVLSFGANRARRFRLGWATLVAMVAIVSIIVTVRYQFLTTQRPPMAPAVATYAPVVEEKALPETDRTRSSPSQDKEAKVAPLGKLRPEVKAMHAKPAATLDFDQSGQVHLRQQPPPPPGPVMAFQGGTQTAIVVDALSEEAKKAAVGGAGEIRAGNLVRNTGGPVQIRLASPAMGREKGEARTVTVKGDVTTSIRQETFPFLPVAQVFAWTLSPKGAVLRSPDEGKTWQPVPLLRGGPFAALSSVGSHVWVGGRNGALYHSADSGQSWHQVVASFVDRTLQADVTRIEFSNPLNGVVSTADGETWTTGDGGLTWRHN